MLDPAEFASGLYDFFDEHGYHTGLDEEFRRRGSGADPDRGALRRGSC